MNAPRDRRRPATLRQGVAPRGARRSHFSAPAPGFTLIELLVVLVIVGVLIATVTLAAGGSSARELENAAQRSRSLIALACERSLISGRDIGFAPLRGGLRFGYFGLDGWRELPEGTSDELRPRPWGAGVELRAERENEPLVLLEEAPRKPPFACLSSGELTPLTLEFSRADVRVRWRLEGRLDGKLTLTSVPDAR